MKLAVVQVSLAFPLMITADADFLDVRVLLDRPSRSDSSPAIKYFHESNFHGHYDGRFADHEVSLSERPKILKDMLRAFTDTMSSIGVSSWIMHGTLLGWWWNQRMLPWDDDIDAQTTEADMAYLAQSYNMTEYRYRFADDRVRHYLLEINPRFTTVDQEDVLNKIDARWIDTIHGLFIDVTVVHPAVDGKLLMERPGHYRSKRTAQALQLMSKDGHCYQRDDIFPLRAGLLEGVHVNIPAQPRAVLAGEYGLRALTGHAYGDYHFDNVTSLWRLTTK